MSDKKKKDEEKSEETKNSEKEHNESGHQENDSKENKNDSKDKENKSKSKDDHDHHDKDSDEQKGTDGDDILTGTAKNDKIEGKDGNDEIYGLAGNDKLKGDDGDDFLYGVEGNDDLDGGDGHDYIEGGYGNDKLEGDDGDDILFGGAGNDDLDGDKGNDILNGGDGNDKLEGGKGNDVLEGGRGKDNIHGEDGDDEIIWSAGDGEDQIRGGKGNDTFTLNTSNTVQQVVRLDTDKKGDLVVSLDGGDQGGTLTLREIENFQLNIGEAGASIQLGDIENGALGDQPLDLGGGAGSDTIDASNSNQAVTIDAGTGDDIVSGGNAADQISGGEGTDIITGGGGDDIIDAGVGDDQVIWKAGDGNDQIDGGDGFDELDMTLDESGPSSLSISADADGNVILIASDGSQLKVDGVEDIVINAGVGGSSITIGDLTGTDIAQDTLYFVGGAGDDSLDASATDRRINAKGNGGNDTLVSGSGDDTLDGGAGDDILDAGSGQGVDTILGGSGNDSITAVLGDEQGSNATDIVDGGADEDSLNVLFVEPTPHDLILRVSSNGDGSFNVTSEDIDVDEILRVSNVENLQITAGEGALNFVLDSLADTTLSNGVDFEGSTDADSFNASGTDVETRQFGNGGDDNLIGGNQDDWLFGGDDNDSLTGGAGNDRLHGEAGDDIMDGSSGTDTAVYSNATGAVSVDLSQFSAQDTGSAGVDTLVNIENLEGSAFSDNLSGNAADNVISGGAGDDTLSGGGGFDYLYGEAGNDTLSDEADTGGLLIGGAGDDVIDGDAAYFNDPNGIIVNYSNAAVDVNGDGSVIVDGRTAIDGYGDTDSFGSNAENLVASQHADHITGSDDGNFIRARAGNDRIHGGDGNDVIWGGSGNDDIDGGDGFDYVHYVDEGFDAAGPATQGINVDLDAGTATDGFGNTDTLSSIEGVFGSNLADTVIGDASNNHLFVRGGDDIVDGGAGNDNIIGWSGNDTIDGGDGDDLITGDTGDDTLTGGSGADTYRFATFADGGSNQFGNDTITDFDTAEDVLNFEPFADLNNLSDVLALTSDDGSNTTISIDGKGDIVLQGVTTSELSSGNFVFANPTTGGGPIVGTENDDVLDGTPGDDVIQGLGGLDFIRGYEGDDYLDGGDGVDLLFGGPGSDILDGNLSIDFAMYAEDPAAVTIDLSQQTAVDGYGFTDTLISIEGAHGSEYDDLIIGSDGLDRLRGRGGDDVIYGGGGPDHILGGDGDDEIYTGADGSWFVDGQAGNDTITGDEFGWDNINGGEGDDTLIDPSGSGILTGGAGNDSIDGLPGYESDPAGIQINFNTSAWDVNGVTVAARTANDGYGDTDTLGAGARNLHASNFDDQVQGDAFSQYFFLRGGNDTAYGLGGDDSFFGGSGNDIIDGGDGFDNASYTDDGFDIAGPATQGVVVNVSGSDFVFDYNGNSGTAIANTAIDGFGDTDTLYNIDSVNGSDLDDVIVGSDTHNWLWGGAGDDQIYGGGDGDNLIGFSGNDLLDGQDGEWDTAWYNHHDQINGINVDLSAGMTFDDGFGDQDTLVSIENVEGSQFDDTIVGDANRNFLAGNDGNDVINAGDGDDSLSGRNGDDEMYAEAGSDWFDAGPGDDLMDGGTDRDYIDYGSWTGTTSGINVDLTNLVNAGPYTSVVVTPDGFGGTDYLRNIEDIHGTDHDDTIIGDGQDNSLQGSGGNDLLAGGAGHDWLSGGDDFDTLEGGDGDDSLDGGENDDTLTGGAGRDQFRFSLFTDEGNPTSFGQDIITDFSITDNDVLDLNQVTGMNNLAALQSMSSEVGSDLVISFVTNTQGIPETNSITLLNMSLSDLPNMDIWYASVNGSDGDDELNAPAGGGNVNAMAGNDILYGSAFHDNLDGGPGDDQLFGNGDNDNLNGGPGNDTLDGGDGSYDSAIYRWSGEANGVVVDLSTGITSNDGFGNTDSLTNIENVEGSEFGDMITGNSEDNFVNAHEGNDIVYGGAGHDGIDGGEGNDQLYGEDGDDWFTGRAGNDLIDGGNGYDNVNYDFWTGTIGPVTVDLSNVVASAGGFTNVVVVDDTQGGTDYLRGIENLSGSQFDDNFTGDANENQFRGEDGNDTLIGNQGNDGLEGWNGNDILSGGPGDDFLLGGAGNDNIDGGDDWDYLAYDQWTGVNQGIVVDLSTGFASNDGFGDTDTISNIESVGGSDFDDLITGDSNNNHLQGQGGNDTLTAFGDNDFLQGGDGDDTLISDGNWSNLEGNAGDDLFILSDSGNVSIGDFTSGAASEDVIDLTGVSSLTNFTEVTAAASDDGFGNTNIDFGNGFGLQLVGVVTADLHIDDFTF